MRIHSFDVECEVCGGPGVGTIRTAAAAWDPRSRVSHVDPRDCAHYLEQKKRDLDKREAALSKE